MVIIFEFYKDNTMLLAMLCKKKTKNREEKTPHTFSSDIVVDAEIEIFAVAHLIIQDDLPLQIKYGDVSAVKSHTRLISTSTPAIKYCRHGEGSMRKVLNERQMR